MNVNDLQDKLLMAVPKKGRLNEATMKLLDGADIRFHRSPRLDIALCTNLPIALIFLNAADIAKFVAEGNVDLGITGQDMLSETNSLATTLLPLGYGCCTLGIQIPTSSPITNVSELIGKRIVTSFPHIVTRYFAALEMGKTHNEACAVLNQPSELSNLTTKTRITFLQGSVETACTLGLADAIVDLIESGATMRASNLRMLKGLLTTESVLIANPKKLPNPLIDTLVGRMRGVLSAAVYVLMTFNVMEGMPLEKALKIAPGKRAATISKLEGGGWVSVSVLVAKKQMADTMDRLVEVGACDILVLDLVNCRVD